MKRRSMTSLSRLKFSFVKKTEDERAYWPDRKAILQIIESMQKISLFLKDGAIV